MAGRAKRTREYKHPNEEKQKSYSPSRQRGSDMLQNNSRDKNDSSSHLYIMDWEQAVARNVQDSYIFSDH